MKRLPPRFYSHGARCRPPVEPASPLRCRTCTIAWDYLAILIRMLDMVALRLPDGSLKEAAPGSTSRQIAESIGKRLAQAAIAAKVDGEIVDLLHELPREGEHAF